MRVGATPCPFAPGQTTAFVPQVTTTMPCGTANSCRFALFSAFAAAFSFENGPAAILFVFVLTT